MRVARSSVPAPAGGAAGRLLRLVAMVAIAVAVLVALAPLAAAEPSDQPSATASPLSVRVTVDRPDVTIDESAPPAGPVGLHYDVVVTNTSDDLVQSVVVRAVLPSGLLAKSPAPDPDGVPRLAAGDLGAGGAWRGSFDAVVDDAHLSSTRLSTVAVAAAGDGSEVVSEPAVTSVHVISAVTVTKPAPTPVAVGSPGQVAPPPPLRPAATVLGATLVRNPAAAAPATLPRTGAPLALLTAIGSGLILAGAVLLHETA